MDGARAARLVETVLRCYPARWRRRHGDEAADLAALLIRDGTPVGSVAWSYLAGAAREWLTPRPGRRLSTVACALLVAACSLGVSAGLLASAAPARAASDRAASTRPASTRPPAPARQHTPGQHTPGQHPPGQHPPGSTSPARGRAHGRTESVPEVIPAASRPQAILRECWRGRSC
jgi:hypothetical protein